MFMLDKEIFEYKDYGTIQIDLDRIMKEKEVTTYELIKPSTTNDRNV